jgi:Holliday junction resolvase RusA-like endonuclease
VSRNRTNGTIKPVFLGSTPVGDVDNYAKFTMDALNQVLYRDDAQVVNIEGQKMYAEDPNSVGSTTITARIIPNPPI